VFLHIKAQELLPVATDDGLRRHHFGVEQRRAREAAMEDAAMPVCPIHHGRNGEHFIIVIQ